MNNAKIKFVDSTDKAALYTIIFEKDDLSEYEKFLSKLRLYCIRLSDKILIVGNGGVKNGKTYQENPELNGYVVDLQKFDKLIDNELKNGSISIEETAIKGIENKDFKL